MNLYEHLNSNNPEETLNVPKINTSTPIAETTPVATQQTTVQPIQTPIETQKDYRTDLMKQIEGNVQEQRSVLDTPYYLTQEESKVVTQAMTDAINNGENPYEVKERWSQAIAFSRFYNLPLSATESSLEGLTEYQLGVKPSYTQTGTRAVINSMRIGGLSVDRAELAEQFHTLYKKGEDTSEIVAKIQALDEEIESLRDYTPRNIVTRILKAAGNSANYSLNVLGASVASNYLGGAINSALGISGPLATVITAAGGFIKGRQLVKYSKFYDQIQAGVDPVAAEWTSELSADIQAAIESLLGIESRLARGLSGGTTALSRKIVENMFIDGSMDKVASIASKAATFGIGYATNLASEFLEESSQQITEMVFDNIAYTLSDMDAPYTPDDIFKESLASGIEGALAAVVSGVGESFVSSNNAIKKAVDLKHIAATTPTVEDFIKKAKEVAPDFVAENKFDSAMRTIWEKTQNQAKEIKAEQSIESTGMANFIASSVENGEVYKDSVVFNDEKSMQDTLKEFKNSTTAITKNDDGSYRLTFTNKDGKQEQITFMTKDMATAQNIETATPFSEGYDEEVRFSGARMSEADFLQNEERKYVREGIASMLGKNATAELVNSGAESVLVASRMLNIPSDELIDKKVVITFTEKTKTPKGKEFRGYMQPTKVGDATVFNITVSPLADTTTLPHEVGHVVRALSSSKALSSFTKRYGGTEGAMWVEDIKQTEDGKYKLGNTVYETYDDAFRAVSPNEEKFVGEFLSYLATGIAPTEEAASIFRQMKNFLKGITQEYGDRLDPDVKESFDNMLKEPSSVQTAQATAERLYQMRLNNEYNTLLSELRNNPKNWDGEHWLAPNGKVSNLTERQYVQVRTQAFKNWFGDWENDPANASKVIDEKGEPRVLYHHSKNANIERFEAGPSTSSGLRGAFFAINPDGAVSSRLGENRYEVFLNIRNAQLAYGDKNKFAPMLRERQKDSTDIEKTNREFVKETGVDGFLDPFNGWYIALTPESIKSATDNNGEFSVDNDNILYQGYDKLRGMSNNAVSAYEAGEKPISKWTRDELLDGVASLSSSEVADILKALPTSVLKDSLLNYSSWHHTGKYYNETPFYSISDGIEDITPSQASAFVDKYKQFSEDVKKYNKEAKEMVSRNTVETEDGEFNTSDGKFEKNKYTGNLIFKIDSKLNIDNLPPQIRSFAESPVETSTSGNVYILGNKPSTATPDEGTTRLVKKGGNIVLEKYEDGNYKAIESFKLDGSNRNFDAYDIVLAVQGNDVSTTKSYTVLSKPIFSESLFSDEERLYQLSDSKREEILKRREEDVKNAVYYGFIVPTPILNEYAGNDWADEELAFRKKFTESSDIAKKAFALAEQNLEAEEKLATPEEEDKIFSMNIDYFMEAVEQIAEKEGIKIEDEERNFWAKVYRYAEQSRETPSSRDRRFVAENASTDEKIIALAKRLANYNDVKTRVKTVKKFDLNYGGDYTDTESYQAISNTWGAFKGVSTKLLRLNKNSTPEQIAEVRTMIAKNPTPYREALDKVMLAEERVDNLKYGTGNQVSFESQLFYQSLGEMMTDEFRLAAQQEEEREGYLNAKMTQEETRELKLEKEEIEKELEETKKTFNEELTKLTKERDKYEDMLKTSRYRIASTEKELKDLEQARKALKEENKALTEKLENVRGKRDKYRHDAAEANAENKTLTKALENARARRDEFRHDASEARKEVDRLNAQIEAVRKKLEKQEKRINRKKLEKSIQKWSKFNPHTELVDYAESLEFLHRVATDDRNVAMLDIPTGLLPYISDELYASISLGRALSDWSDSELQSLAEAVVLVRNDARQAKEDKDSARRASLNTETYNYFSQSYGYLGALKDGQMQIRELTKQMMLNQKKYDDAHKGGIIKLKNTVKDAIIKPQRLARQLDSNREGVIYNRFVREAWVNAQNEKANEDRRYEAFKAKAKELGITDKVLSEDLTSYKAIGTGEEIELTRGQAIGVYVYSQNPISARKLGAVGGNRMGMDGLQINEVISKLSDNDKAWGDYLIDELGGDETWNRMDYIYRTVYNRQLGRRNRYFTFVADDTNYQGNTDLLVGPQGNPVAYTDKGMTKEIDERAMYPLQLDVTKTYLSQVARQEHFIAWASWVRDSNYQLNPNFGGMGTIIEQKFGNQAKKTLQNYINDVARPNQMMTDLEKLYSKVLSNYAMASLAGNFMTVLKQAPSIASALRGDVGFTEFVTAGQRLIRERKATMEFINSKTTDIKNRSIDQELTNYKNYTELGLAESALSKTANFLMLPTQFVDKSVCAQLWLAAYETGIHKGLSEDEAVFKASQLINETQPTSGSTNLSEIQRNKSPFVRAMIMFTNQIMNVMNQIYFDLPYFVKTHNTRKFIGTIANIACSAGAMIALSGAFLEDDEDKKRKKVWQAFIQQAATYAVPFFGGDVGEVFSMGDLISLPGALGDFLRSWANTEESYWAKIGKEAWDLAFDAMKAMGTPVTPVKRAVDSVRNANPMYMFGTSLGEATDKD